MGEYDAEERKRQGATLLPVSAEMGRHPHGTYKICASRQQFASANGEGVEDAIPRILLDSE